MNAEIPSTTRADRESGRVRPTRPDPIRLATERAVGPRGTVVYVLRSDFDEPAIREALADPDAHVPPPTKRSQIEKQYARRAVHSFFTRLSGAEVRLYLKFYRVRSPKDALEELAHGKRARRAFLAGIEAERRGIDVPVHIGYSHADVADRRPARSVLLTLGVPHNQSAERVLNSGDLSPSERARLVAAVGRFAGDAHRRGLIHGDLKLGNVFVRERDPPHLCILDLDRARFAAPDSRRVPASQILDLRGLLRSAHRLSAREQNRLLLAWFEGRRVPQAARARILRRLACTGAFGRRRTDLARTRATGVPPSA